MNLKKTLVALSLSALAFGAAATPLDAIVGNVNVKLSGLTTESGTYGGDGRVALPDPMNPGGVIANPTYVPGAETTWGVGTITEVQGTGGQKWQAGSSDGTYLYYMIYGIADQNIIPHGDGTFDIFNVGASGFAGADGKIHLDIYRTNTEIIAIDSDFNASPSGRTSYSTYNLLQPLGPAYLQLVFNPGKQLVNVPGGANPAADETQASLRQNASAVTLPAVGSGSFFADVIGGTAAVRWDTNGLFGHDLDGNFTLATNGAQYGSGVCTPAQVASNQCFTGLINDPIRASVVLPEPGSLALFGLTLAGLAGARRRMSKKAK